MNDYPLNSLQQYGRQLNTQCLDCYVTVLQGGTPWRIPKNVEAEE